MVVVRRSKRLQKSFIVISFLVIMYLKLTPTPYSQPKLHQRPHSCPTTLQGLVNVTLTNPPSFEEIESLNSDILGKGGHYKPRNCNSSDKVAIIIPYRDREEHLRLFLFNFLPFLKRQNLDFTIYVVEQAKYEPFNRGMLLNVGFTEANKLGDYDCFFFHDVDYIPENDYNLYTCPLQPTHMTVSADRYNWELPFSSIFGGVTSFTKAHFRKINGYSNSYWGWGAEDDDAYQRVLFHGLDILRPPISVARYRSLKHTKVQPNLGNVGLFRTKDSRYLTDGLNNLKYTLEEVALKKTYTLLKVRFERPVNLSLPSSSAPMPQTGLLSE